mmetsp:Transcript_16809/g.26238  ORF Transcript_16809/g.26238 Transcript_16809/m.26238 type:complete len:101 (+) Transcript_16809:2505-2807(+)
MFEHHESFVIIFRVRGSGALSDILTLVGMCGGICRHIDELCALKLRIEKPTTKAEDMMLFYAVLYSAPLLWIKMPQQLLLENLGLPDGGWYLLESRPARR